MKSLIELHRALLLPRLIEEKMVRLVRQGRLSKWFSGLGQEAIAVGVTAALHDGDWILPSHRNLGVFTGRQVPLPTLLRQLFAREGGFTEGRDRTFHFGIRDKQIVGMISHLAAMLPVADGLALAAQLKSSKDVVAVFTGDGATSEGDFHEALNLAAVWKLPVIFVVENNQYGLSTPAHEQYACRDLADRAVGYGMPGHTVDGNDLLAVIQAVKVAAERARRGEGPTLMECKTFRMRGHEEASGTAYVPTTLTEEWALKDPILRFEKHLLESGTLPRDEMDRVRAELTAAVDVDVEEALQAPAPTSTPEKEVLDVYASSTDESEPRPAQPSDPEMRYVDAIRDALRTALRDQPEVLLLGQDIAEYGGVFKATEGLAQEFGKGRVRNTPIIESGALGAALGLALDGFHPMVEMQFGDFVSCGFNQIVNNLAKTHYRWGAAVPVVVRLPIGGGVGAGPFHSQNMESWFTNVAGLKVVAPSNPYDAKGLLLAAFADPNPVLYLEHKYLYRQAKSPVPAEAFRIPIGRAIVRRQGQNATIVTYSIGVHWALAAADQLASEGKGIEVIDLRSLIPWDIETVLSSVRKTGRVLVLHEAPITGGFGGELAARIGQEAFEWLDAPIVRVGSLDTPVPFSKKLEEQFSAQSQLVPALRRLLAY